MASVLFEGLFVSLLLAVVSFSQCESTPSLVDVITTKDLDRLSKLLQQAPIDDLQTAHSVVAGLSLAAPGKTEIKPTQSKVCQFLKQQKKIESAKDMFYVTSTASALGSACDVKYSSLKDRLFSLLTADGTTISDIYYVVSSLTSIGAKVDNGSLSLSTLVGMVEKEESLISYGHAFSAAALISGGDVSGLVDLMEEVVAQADETPETLYFDGGLEVTSTILSGLFQLAGRGSEKAFLTQTQATKFGNYLVSGKFTSSVNNVYFMLSAANHLANNKVVVPAALLLSSRKPINSQNPNLRVRLTNVMGAAVGASAVKLVTILDPAGEKETRNKPFSVESDRITYSIGLAAAATQPGTYKVTLSSEPKGDSPVTEVSVEYAVSVSYTVVVSKAELSTVDKEQGIPTKTVSLKYPDKASESPVADHTSKVRMTFTLTNKESGGKVKVHQAFVRLVSVSGDEIFYVAQPDSNEVYVFELNVAESAKDFSQRSGTYSIDLIVGDSATENSLVWAVGSVVLNFPGKPPETSTDEQNRYKPKPVIQHMFNPPEKRPPSAVSSGFTILVLVPLVGLLGMWLIIGVNISGLSQGGVWGILFHVGLIGIFALYYMFWVKLNMFQTLKYLAVVGGVTFVAGNRLLRRVAQKA